MSLKQSSKEPVSSRSVVPACWGRDPDRDCLRIETGEGETFILPYQHFVTAHFQRQDNGEVLTISFASHQLRLEGRRMEEIVEALQEYAVAWISPTPVRYERLREGDSAAIAKLEIKAVE
jgi:hypothetical protein